jgi:hypothetical protein
MRSGAANKKAVMIKAANEIKHVFIFAAAAFLSCSPSKKSVTAAIAATSAVV